MGGRTEVATVRLLDEPDVSYPVYLPNISSSSSMDMFRVTVRETRVMCRVDAPAARCAC